MTSQTTPSWLMLALPAMMIVTCVKALIGAARNPRGNVGLIAVALVFIGSLSSALLLWSHDFLAVLGGFGNHYGRPLGIYLLGDLILHGIFWTAFAKLCIHLARKYPAKD